MARSPFPAGDFGRRTSGALPGTGVGAPAAGAAGAVAEAAHGFGRQVRKMAEAAWTREGEADAARAIAAEGESGIEARFRGGERVDDAAYDAVVREHRLARRQTAYLDAVAQAEIQHGEDVGGFAEAMAATRQAFRDRPTGDAATDAAFARFTTLQDGAAMRRVREGAERARIRTARGAWQEARAVGETQLGQAIAGAGFDEGGAALVGAGLTQYAERLSRFGPREAFSLGGVEFAADPTRAGAVSPEELAQAFDAAQTGARAAWIQQAQDLAPSATEKRAFAGQVQERWAAGDPAFVGLSAGQAQQIFGRLEAGAARAEADEAAAMRGAGERARDLMRAIEYGGDGDWDEVRDLARASGDPGLAAEVDYRAAYGFVASPRADARGGAAGGFAGAVDFVMDVLEGGGTYVADDNGAGPTRWGINARANPDLDIRNLTRPQAVARYRRDYWDPINGDALAPDLALAAFDAAVNQGPGKAREWLAASGGDVGRFMALREAHYRELAASSPRHARNLNGWLSRLGRVRGAIATQAAQRRAAEGYATDPIGYARGNRNRPALATVAEFDPNAVFDGRAGEWGAALRQRRDAGHELSRRDGVPFRMLSGEEVQFYKAQIERDPAAVVTLAAAAMGAFGNNEADARALLLEIGRGGLSDGDLLLGQLAVSPLHRTIVNRAIEGRALRQQGASLPVFEDGGSIQKTMAEWGQALDMPEIMVAAQQVAQDFAIADQAAGRLGAPASYLNSALGAVRHEGRTFGGVTTVNGRRTIAPTWLEARMLDEALEAVARNGLNPPPVYSNGQPIPAGQIARMRMRLSPSGRYQLLDVMSGRPATRADGRVFELDLEAASVRDLLRARLPGAVLDR